MAFNDLGLDTRETDICVLQELVRRIKEPVCVEVGSWVGRTALAMIDAGAAIVYCVDTWNGSYGGPKDPTRQMADEYGKDVVFETFCENIGPDLLYKRIIPREGLSCQLAKHWAFQADLIFIDASHDYESVRDDIAAWTPHVKAGGILCGHDFEDYFPGVVQAVKESGEYQAKENVWWREIK